MKILAVDLFLILILLSIPQVGMISAVAIWGWMNAHL